MKILINSSNLKLGGAIQVAHSFINEIRTNRKHQFYVVLSKELSEQININDFNSNFKFYSYSITPRVLKSFIGKDYFLDNLENRIKPDRVFSVFGPTYWKPIAKHIVGFAKPQYIYKDSPFFKQIMHIEKLKLKLKEFLHIHDIKKFSSVVITESEDVSNRLSKLIKSKNVYTVTNYFNQIYKQPKKWDRTINLGKFDGVTLLTISSFYPHKNLNIVPKVVRYLLGNYPDFKFRFVLTISQSDIKILDADVKDKIIFLGPIKINQGPYLYKQSDFMFLPTLLECFSASYPEAMYMKKPILTSDLPFAYGLCGNAAIYFNPTDVKDIAEKIYLLAVNKQKQQELIKNGINRLKTFDNYEQRAKKYLEIIENS